MQLYLFSILLILIKGNLKGCDSSFATCILNLMEMGHLIHFLQEDTHKAQ